MISVFTYLFAILTTAPTTADLPIETVKQTSVFEEAKDIEWKKTTHDFGDITQGTKAKYVFTFINKGSKDVIITNAQASCGCTVPNFSKEPIAPGGTGSVTVIFDSSGKSGIFTKNINVTTSAGQSTLFIKGNVVVEAPKPKSPVQIGD